MKVDYQYQIDFRIKPQDVLDEYPEDWELAKAEGKSPKEFIIETIADLGIEDFSVKFGRGVTDSVELSVG